MGAVRVWVVVVVGGVFALVASSELRPPMADSARGGLTPTGSGQAAAPAETREGIRPVSRSGRVAMVPPARDTPDLAEVEAAELTHIGASVSQGESARDGAPPDRLQPGRLAELIEDLRDDDVRFNAESARYRLRSAGPEALAPLQEALHSSDWQQRQLAAYVLAGREDAIPTSALARVLVEALRDDALPFGSTSATWQGSGRNAYNLVYNRERALRALRRDPLLFDLAVAGLVAALDSSDAQQSLSAAYALARQRSGVALERTCERLIAHLRDNQIRGDARDGLEGLGWYAGAATPYVLAALPGEDDQQRTLLAHWLGHFVPSHPRARRLSHEELAAVGLVSGDPCLRNR